MLTTNFKSLVAALCAVVCMLIVPAAVVAQTEVVDSGETVAYMNVSESTILDQDDTNITVSFKLDNQGSRPQFDIRYGIELITKQGEPGAETQVIVDSYIADEVLVVTAGEARLVGIDYPVTGIAPGNYELWVVAQTSGGSTLGLGFAGSVTIEESSAVELVAETCRLTVAGETNASYDLYQGVDVGAGEELIVSCLIKNHGVSTATVIPVFETYRRNIYGDKVNLPAEAYESIVLPAGEEALLTLEVPKALQPQAYDAVLRLVDQTTLSVRSNNLIIHYVLQGQSATIQTVDFSANSYAAGEDIIVTLQWSGAADGFEDARLGGSANGEINAVMSVVDGEGQVCAEEKSVLLESPSQTIISSSNIDCVQPAASIKLVAADGTVLDSRDIAVLVTEDPNQTISNETNATKNNYPLILGLIIMVSFLLLTLLLLMNKKGKNSFKDTVKTLCVFAVAASGFFGVQVERVEAISWVHYWANSSGPKEHLVTFNTNKTVYSPGERVVGTYQIRNNLCSNSSTPAHNFTGRLNGVVTTISYRTSNAGTLNGTVNMTAPTAPGVYNITLRMQVLGYVSTRNVQISVNAPPPPPPPPSGSVSGTGCTIAVGASTCQGQVNWNISGASSPNLRNITRSYTYSFAANGFGPQTLWYGSNQIAARNSGTNLATASLAASCVGGTVWNGSVCASNPQPAIGYFDAVDAATCSIAGWAYDPDVPSQSLLVHVYSGNSAGAGGTFVTSCNANQFRSDVNAAYGISGNHGFNCTMPASFLGAGSQNLYVHAIDVNGAPNNVIGASPRALNCPAAVPLPPSSVSVQCPATPGGQFVFDWPASGGATDYQLRVDYPSDPAPHLVQVDSGLSARTHSTNILVQGTQYVAWVHACNSGGCSVGVAQTTFTCPVPPPPPPPPPATGSVSVTGCQIAEGASTCTGTATWDINNATNPIVHNSTTNNPYSTDPTGLNQSITLGYGVNTVNARDDANILDTANTTTSCVAGTEWSGSTCTLIPPPPPPEPTISLSLSRELIRSGETVDVTVDVVAEYEAVCTIYGVESTPIVFTHNGTPADPISSRTSTSRPLKAAQVVTVTCEPNPANGAASNTATSRVDVIPAVQEI